MKKKTWKQAAIVLMSVVLAFGTVTYSDLFGALFQLKGVEYTYSGDIACGDICESYINVTTSYWRICFAHYNGTKYEDQVLFKKVPRSRTLHVNLDKVNNIINTAPDVPVDWMVPARGGKWRNITDGDCWERGKLNRIKLVGHKKRNETVKWNFMVGSFVDIDPYWKTSDFFIPKEKYIKGKNKKYSMLEGINISSVSNIKCSLLGNKFDSLRNCTAFIQVNNYRDYPYYLKPNFLKLDWKYKPKYIFEEYSTKYKYKTINRINDSCLAENPNSTCTYQETIKEYYDYSKIKPKRINPNSSMSIYLNWIDNYRKDGNINQFNVSIQGNKYLKSSNIKLDPTVTACTDITSSGYYILDNDITSATDKCINISVSDVTFDCNGHQIRDFNSDFLIYAHSPDGDIHNITIKNCNVYGAIDPIYFYKALETEVNNVTAQLKTSTSGTGAVFYSNSGNATINNCYLVGDNADTITPVRYYDSYGAATFHIYNTVLGNASSAYAIYFKTYYSNLTMINISINTTYLMDRDGFNINNPNLPVNLINVTKWHQTDGIYIDDYNYNKDISTWNNVSTWIMSNSTAKTLKDYTFPNINKSAEMIILTGCNNNRQIIQNITANDNDYIKGIHNSYHCSFNMNKNNIRIANKIVYSYYPALSTYSYIYNNTFYINNLYGQMIYSYHTDNVMIENNTFSNGNIIYMLSSYSNGWKISNNLFNTTQSDYGLYDLKSGNYLNKTLGYGDRIYENSSFHTNTIGGNFYVKPDGTGYSLDCDDNDKDGFCDTEFSNSNGVTDELTLSDEYAPVNNPYWQNNQSSGTDAGTEITFSVLWNVTDPAKSNLSSYVFSMHNGTNWTYYDESSNNEENNTITAENNTGPATTLLSYDFESGALGSDWTTYSSDATYGRIGVRNDISAHSGTYSVVADVNTNGHYNLNELITAYDFTGATEVYLEFYHDDIGDEETSGADHTNHYNSDALYYTCDGTNWYLLYNFPSVSRWTYYNINITNDPDWCGTADSNFKIKFTQYDNYKVSSDGRAWDLINITYKSTSTIGADTDANKTEKSYESINVTTYEEINSIRVKAHISKYDNSGSTTNGNNNPDLYLKAYNGTAYENISLFSITGTGNFSVNITDNTIFQAWKIPANRKISILPMYFDYAGETAIDNITYDGLWVDIDSNQEWFNFSYDFVSTDCVDGNMSLCWANVTKKVSETVGDLIKWKMWANTTVNLTNKTDVFTFLTTTPSSDSCTYSGSGQWDIDCSDNCNFVETDVLGNIVKISGVGKVESIANIKDYSAMFISGGCQAIQ